MGVSQHITLSQLLIKGRYYFWIKMKHHKKDRANLKFQDLDETGHQFRDLVNLIPTHNPDLKCPHGEHFSEKDPILHGFIK